MKEGSMRKGSMIKLSKSSKLSGQSELREETLRMPAGDLGPESPLPVLPPLPQKATKGAKPKKGWRMRVDPSVPRSDRKNFGYGGPMSVLPYHMQDDYGRRRHTRAFRTVVLENEFLRAEFLIGLGGRLRSLTHKPSGRELLYVNPVFQPANLAIRNAWFSGGVEWNIGIRGHCPFTCSPLFASELRRSDGTPVLRMYEWERVRGVTFQVDACLPAGSQFLLVHVRIVNPHGREIPMYWWSNSAVPEGEGTRILAPADSALRTDYAGIIRAVPVPPPEGPDVTYPTNLQDAADFFYRIPRGRRPWVASLDPQGRGMIQTSTPLLRGRKLFVWGMSAGGRRWQEFLSVPGAPYVEIQAGLARTQYEYIPMPASTQWSWLEAYGLMEAPPRAVHGKDCDAAREAVATKLEETLPARQLNAELERMRAIADAPPARIFQRGSGWGALERLRRQRFKEPPMATPGTPFDDESLGEDQQPWLGLLAKGTDMKETEKAEKGTGTFSIQRKRSQSPFSSPFPGATLVQEEWRKILESAVRAKKWDDWHAWLHLGTLRYAAGDVNAARAAWEKSLERQPTAWALRNLAVLARHEGRSEESADLYLRALQALVKGAASSEAELPLGFVAECFYSLLGAKRERDVLETVKHLPPAVARRGRVRLIRAQAALAVGDWRLAQKMLGGLEVDDIREGDNAVTELWFHMHEQRLADQERRPIDDELRQRVRRELPPPKELDYRMFRQKT
jgi:hypothetical protein